MMHMPRVSRLNSLVIFYLEGDKIIPQTYTDRKNYNIPIGHTQIRLLTFNFIIT